MSAKKTIVILMIVTLLTAAVNVVGSLDFASEELTSFPWWSVFVLTAYYFGPVLLVEGLALLGVHLREKRKKQKEK